MDNEFRSTATIPVLQQRAKLLREIRQFFDLRGFFEVETPLLSNDVVVDRFLDPVPVRRDDVLPGRSATERTFWLQTSPEFAMKRLLASGAKAIYQITKAFRAGESGSRHNPEFTMLEWYRVNDNYEDGRKLLSDFATRFFNSSTVGSKTYRDAFLEIAKVDPFEASISKLIDVAASRGVEVRDDAENEDIDFWRNVVLSHVIEPELGLKHPEIIFDWPASQSALAKVRNDSTPVAERFELYVDGTELANGYHELLDAAELSARNASINHQRVNDGKARLPNESRLLSAMENGLPPCSGVALGIDRLAMVLLGKNTIGEVIPFPIEIA